MTLLQSVILFITMTVVALGTFFVDAFKGSKTGRAPVLPAVLSIIKGVIAGAAVLFLGTWSFHNLGAITYVFLVIAVAIVVSAMVKHWPK